MWQNYIKFISVINQLEAQSVLSQPVHEMATYRCDDTRGCVMQFWPPDDKHMCSTHVEAWNKLIVKQKFCASNWLITELNTLRCTVSKTSKNYIKCSDCLKLFQDAEIHLWCPYIYCPAYYYVLCCSYRLHWHVFYLITFVTLYSEHFARRQGK